MSTNCGTTPTSCVAPDQSTRCCPSSFCHDGLLNLPERHRLNLMGIEQGSRCASTFPRTAQGFVLYDSMGGAIITSQPTVPIPYLRNLILGTDGKPVPMVDGRPQEDDPPGFQNLLVADECGKQWRLHGRNGFRQRLLWNGCNFIMEADLSAAELAEFPSVFNGNDCNYFEAVLVDTGGGTYALGYKQTRSRFAGEITMFGGPKNLVGSDWLVCDGALYDPLEYPNLFAAIGYTWGKQGSDFRVPDMRGQFARGVDDGALEDPDAASRTAKYPDGNTGDSVGSYQRDAFQCHTHTYNVYGVDTIVGAEIGDEFEVAGPAPGTTPETSEANESNCGALRTADETRPINAGVFYVIYAGCKIE